MSPVESLIGQIARAGGRLDFYGPQDTSAIDRLEGFVGVALPPSYRAFLAKYGGGYGLTGLFGNAPEKKNPGCLLGDTLRLQDQYGLPGHFVPVHLISLGGVACLDSRFADERGEYSVVQFAFGSEGKLTHETTVARSFEEYLQAFLEVRLEVLLEEDDEGE